MKISKSFWIGLVFISSAIVFIVGLLYIQDISIQKSNYSFTVLFDNVQGLHVGDQVDMLGKKIGKTLHLYKMKELISFLMIRTLLLHKMAKVREILLVMVWKH